MNYLDYTVGAPVSDTAAPGGSIDTDKKHLTEILRRAAG